MLVDEINHLICFINDIVSGELTKCQRLAQEANNGELMVGAYIPQCTETGAFVAKQCHGSTGYCWCVDIEGEEVEGTRAGPGETALCLSKSFLLC